MKQSELSNLLSEMTIAEKIGQLVQLTPDFFSEGGEITGPMQNWQMEQDQLFQIGSVLGTHTADQVARIQKQYLQKSRLKIPLVFMADVIHGYETIFPIPLALAASFDPELIEKVAKNSALEGARAGVHVTFSPMADYVKDPRWGRVLESNGEDVTLSKELTKAYVRGYQGESLQSNESLAACLKHFIGYGAAEGGRDYNTVDFSDLEMYQNYLPPFKAGIDQGAELVMTSFNTVRGIPATGNRELLQNILRNQLAFDGVIISDWGALAELIAHRVAEDSSKAAELAFSAGIDMDMMSDSYLNNLAKLITPENSQQLDEAVMRILNLKNKLGLFENPYRGIVTESPAEKNQMRQELRKVSKEAALKSTILLKNQGLLPLKAQQSIALIGPKATSQDLLGAWSWIGKKEEVVSLEAGLSNRTANLTTLAMKDGEVLTEADFAAAVSLAKKKEVVIVALGETSEEAGEAASLADLKLSRNQDELIYRIAEVNPNIVLVLFSGRPLVLTNVEPFVKSIVAGWFPGTEGGQALADLLYGISNFSAKLPMSFPRSVGQLPLSYGQFSTGRPLTAANADQKYISRYMDEENTPLYAFGHGQNYSDFSIDFPAVKIDQIDEEHWKVTAPLKNKGVAGREVLQLYIQDLVTQVARPMRELKLWQSVDLAENQGTEVELTITTDELCYVHADLQNYPDPGSFALYLGFDSQTAVEIGRITYN